MSEEPVVKKPDPLSEGSGDAFASGGWAEPLPAPEEPGSPVPGDPDDVVIFPEHWRVVGVDDKGGDGGGGNGGGGGGPPGGSGGGGAAEPNPVLYSEDALAKSLAERICDDFKYVPTWGWLRWDGQRWADDDGADVVERARLNCREKAAELVDSASSLKRKIASAAFIVATIRLARSDHRVVMAPRQFEETSGWLLNTPQGIVDLRTGILGLHRRQAWLTNMTAVAPEGDCPNWRRFVLEFCAGDEVYAEYLQRVAGYCLMGFVKRPAWFFLFGPQGGEGKSLFIHTLQRLMGDYAVTAMMGLFMVQRAGERHPTELAALKGKRLVVATETQPNQEWDEAKIKSLTGGDIVSARVMRGDQFEFVPICKLMMSGNHRPWLRSADGGTRERLNLCPANHKPETPDFDLEDKLVAELPGILVWAIEGAVAVAGSMRLRPPKIVRQATDDYFLEQNPVQRWFRACCQRQGAGDDWAPVHEGHALYLNFKTWQVERGEKPWSEVAFLQRLRLVTGALYTRTRQGRGWTGFKLRPNASEEGEFGEGDDEG